MYFKFKYICINDDDLYLIQDNKHIVLFCSVLMFLLLFLWAFELHCSLLTIKNSSTYSKIILIIFHNTRVDYLLVYVFLWQRSIMCHGLSVVHLRHPGKHPNHLWTVLPVLAITCTLWNDASTTGCKHLLNIHTHLLNFINLGQINSQSVTHSRLQEHHICSCDCVNRDIINQLYYRNTVATCSNLSSFTSVTLYVSDTCI